MGAGERAGRPVCAVASAAHRPADLALWSLLQRVEDASAQAGLGAMAGLSGFSCGQARAGGGGWGKPLSGFVTGRNPNPKGIVCDDCHYAELGDEIEKNPIGRIK